MKFRKKPVIVDAMVYEDTKEGHKAIQVFCPKGRFVYTVGSFVIPTLEGEVYARPGDWIIKGVASEFYPCKDAIFRATYEPVDDEDK